MKRNLLKTVKILIAYIMLNIGVLSWIEVSAVSGNKLSVSQEAMAEIKTNSKQSFEISVLGKHAVFDFSFIESTETQTLLLAYADPVLTAVLSEISSVYDF